MANKMLIDAMHPEETRVVVVRGTRVEEFDFESASRRQLRGNIYLAKVTRVEPSLQAAFVDYGGNRHGFLAFSEIHPDYYQIPVADREALIEEEAEEQSKAASEDDDAGDDVQGQTAAPEDSGESDETADDNGEAAALDAEDGSVETKTGDDDVESVGSDDALEEIPARRAKPRRHYKIQEVIKRRQVMLVQVVKEERGNKGAALTTYLSLAGRYCVLMPNTARGGGISRKITNAPDRKRLKDMVRDLDVATGMGLILRTAGASRTKAEIKRDFDYLLRLWENVRELTLQSIAPMLVYEEGSLVKRAIRDLYNKDIDQVLVASDEAYKEAKSFMRMLMPSHAKNVQPYKDEEPIFTKFRVEKELDAMFNPTVTLPSGGYIVINQTEALVSIDVNSGKSTREHNIEDTALRTNQEAAEEVARQLRLRDLAGLIVIDFIDMDEKRNNRSVERKLKDCLRNDRARIQVGRISPFGLLEMSRQRIRSGILEGSLEVCPHCHGTGYIRSTESVALHVIRMLDDELMRKAADLTVHTSTAAALYILNHKRQHLRLLEERYGVDIAIFADDTLKGTLATLERGDPRKAQPAQDGEATLQPASIDPDDEVLADADGDDERTGKKRRRRRRKRGSNETDERAAEAVETADGEDRNGDEADTTEAASAGGDSEGEPSERGRRRRRGRRGGRRRGGESVTQDAQAESDQTVAVNDDAGSAAELPEAEVEQTADVTAESVLAESSAPASIEEMAVAAAESEDPAPAANNGSGEPEEVVEANHDGNGTEADVAEVDAAETERNGPSIEDVPQSTEPEGPPRKGWWQRRIFGE